MKKILALLTVFVLLSSSFLSLGATTVDRATPDAPPGFTQYFAVYVEPTSNCRAGVANTAGSGDYLYGSLWDGDGNFQWGEPVITYSAVEDEVYYTIPQYTDCQYPDGSYGEVRNTTYPTELFLLRYQYDY